MNWQKMLDRLSIPGLLLLVLGAVMGMNASKIAKTERLAFVLRVAGVVLALAGALILLDFIPGL
ncbi:MAG: hypothetical protein J6K55_03115 [Clostridia bacterium]|nr:hypothetical protein [Clostridia bacterium]